MFFMFGFTQARYCAREKGTMKRFLMRTVVVLAAALLLLAGVMLYRTMTFTSMQIQVAERPLPEVNMERAVDTLSAALRFPTIADLDISKMDASVFLAMHAMLAERFPLVHERLHKEVINGLSLLYHWKGADPGQKAILLLAHQDVVPAPDAESWEQAPFSGVVSTGCVWGRGAMDDKGSLISILNAVETLLEKGFQPRRDIYLCFGHDEEVGGLNGAARIAATLAERGVQAVFTLDEGLAVVDGDLFGLNRPVALVALTEKGYLSLELKAESAPGHSSTPPKETAIGSLAAAVTRVVNAPMSPRLTEPVRLMFRYLGPEMAFPMRVVLANLWLTRPLLLRQLSGAPTTDATIRTTTAATIIRGGETENVLPAEARAVVNFRLLPGDTIAGVTKRTRNLIASPRIALAVQGQANESPSPSRADGPGFAALQQTIGHVFPEALVAPSLMIGGSDTHHYAAVAENTYGFQPLHFCPGDLERIHGRNERLGVESFKRMIIFYMTLLERAGS